jgi:hypothetical protein
MLILSQFPSLTLLLTSAWYRRIRKESSYSNSIIDNTRMLVLVLLFPESQLCVPWTCGNGVTFILPMGDRFNTVKGTRALYPLFSPYSTWWDLASSFIRNLFFTKGSCHGVLLWSLAQIATPFAAYIIQVLLLSRFFMGWLSCCHSCN